MHRRTFLSAAAGAAAAAGLTAPARAAAPGSLLAEAEALSREPYRAPTGDLPAPFAGLDYDAYRAIRPIPGRAAELPVGRDYAVDLLPPGLYFPDPVAVEFLRPDGTVDTVPFAPDMFTFDPAYFANIPDRAPGAGYSGLRLRHPLNRADVMDEFLVMQGGTYFRAIARDTIYGLSSRLLAIGTGGPDPEEFPRFTRIRIDPPQGGMSRIEAVIDSPSLTGHMEMRAEPGETTRTRVSLTLFPRTEIANGGVGALTSMYLKSPLHASVADDFRPAVHDSDVLAIDNGAGEQLWRPLSNPATVQTSTFVDDGPRGYGLYQTARRFEDYQDPEARYHARPSARIVPRGDWGPGAVTLVEIPTADEFMDNIVAFWRPEAPLSPGRRYRFDYDVVWTADTVPREMPVRLGETRTGRKPEAPGARLYAIDLHGPAEGARPEVTATDDAEVEGVTMFGLPDGETHRVSFLLRPRGGDASELRVSLREDDGTPVAPVWLHRWTPASDGGA